MPTPLNELPFIFIIGFNKSATTSLHMFFQNNGFPSIHWDHGKLARTMLLNCCDDRPILSGYDQKYRVFSDMTFRTHRLRFEGNSLFRILDSDYPGSFFIYNYRNVQDWLRSRESHRGTIDGETLMQLEMRLLKATNPQKVLDRWRKSRSQFEKELRDYFSNYPKFIEIDIADSDLPTKLSRFLGMPLDRSHWQVHNRNPRAS
jgi:hypothetical protein